MTPHTCPGTALRALPVQHPEALALIQYHSRDFPAVAHGFVERVIDPLWKNTLRVATLRSDWRDSNMPTNPRLTCGRFNVNRATSSKVGA